jgi:hypothetical protein
MPKLTNITVETESLLILRGGRALQAWCPGCGSEVEMIPLDGIGVISNLNPPEVEAWIESEDLHHSEGADGTLRICLNSMLKRVRKPTMVSHAIEQLRKRRR